MEMPTTIAGWIYLFAFGGLGFLFVITLVVFVHELGHFLTARYFGVRVESFSIGFGRAIAGFTDRHGTFWKIGWLPLGGYVKFWGDEGVSSTPDHSKVDNASAAERAGSFHHKPLYQKAIIAVGGPAANFILAVAIFAGLFFIYGYNTVSPQLGQIIKGAPADKAGLKTGDIVRSIDGDPIKDFKDIIEHVTLSQGQVLSFRVERAGEEKTIEVVPGLIELKDMLGRSARDTGIGVAQAIPGEVGEVVPDSPAALAGLKAGDVIVEAGGEPMRTFADLAAALKAAGGQEVPVVFFRLETNEKTQKQEQVRREAKLAPAAGVAAADDSDAFVRGAVGIVPRVPGGIESNILVRLGPVEAVAKAFDQVRFIVVKTLTFIGELLTGSGNYQQLSGPIGIAVVSGQVLVFFGVVYLINLAAVLSVSIGLLNLFPIPMLDGGHLLYYGIEAVRGRPLGERAQELGFRIGLALVVSLMLFATWNDVTLRLF
jgi:regulator of sigma E protease